MCSNRFCNLAGWSEVKKFLLMAGLEYNNFQGLFYGVAAVVVLS